MATGTEGLNFLFFFSSSVQSLSQVQLFATPWTAARQASLSITNFRSLLTLMSIELVMPSNHPILCHLLLLPSLFPSIRVFSNESVLHIRWPKDWSFSFTISPSNEYSGLISLRMDWLDLLAVQGLSSVFSNTIVQKHQFFSAQPSLWFNSHIHTCKSVSSVAQLCLTLFDPMDCRKPGFPAHHQLPELTQTHAR